MVAKDSVNEETLRYSNRDSYTWKVYEKWFVKRDPAENDLYMRGMALSVKRALEEDVVFVNSEETVFLSKAYQECKIAQLQEKLPALPLSFPLRKGDYDFDPLHKESKFKVFVFLIKGEIYNPFKIAYRSKIFFMSTLQVK